MTNVIEIVIKGKNEASSSMKSASKDADSLGKSLSHVGSVAGGILAADTISKIGEKARDTFSKSIEAASSLGESMNAVDKIFGSSAEKVKTWGEQNAVSFGLSQRAFNEMAVPLGASLKNAGIDMDTVGTKTIDLTKRAADMASVFNTDVSDALEAIQAGLRGESDPLERYGVGLSAATVQQRALADSGKEAASQLTTQDTMLARLALIMDQTASTAGDFADTQDGLANATRISNAKIEEAQAKLGEALLPVMAKGAEIVGEFADNFRKLPGPLQTAIAIIGGVAAAALLLAPRIIAAKQALNDMGISSSSLNGKLGMLTKGFALAAAAAVGLEIVGQIADNIAGKSDGIVQMTDALKELGKTGEFADDLQKTWGGAFGDAGQAAGGFGLALRKALDPTVLDQFSDPMDRLAGILPGLNSQAEHAAGNFQAMDDALAGMVSAGHADQAADSFAQIKQIATQLHLPVDRLKELFPQYYSALDATTASTDKVAEATGKATEETKDLAGALDDLTKNTFDAEQAEEDYYQALEDVKNRIKETRDEHIKGADALNIHTKAGRDNREALRELAEKAQDTLIAMQNLGKSEEDITGTSARQRAEFVKAAIQLGLNKKAAEELADKYGLIPKEIKTAIKGDSKQAEGVLTKFLGTINRSRPSPIIIRADASAAYGVLNQLLAKINGSSARVGIGVLKKASGGIISAYAYGGVTGQSAGRVAMVGEEGPEMVRLPYGSTVIPAGQTRALLQDYDGYGEYDGYGDYDGYATGGAVGVSKNRPKPRKSVSRSASDKGVSQSSGPGRKVELDSSVTSHQNYIEPQIGTAVSVDIGEAVSVGPQIGTAVSTGTTGVRSSGSYRSVAQSSTSAAPLQNSVSRSSGVSQKATVNIYIAGSILSEKELVNIVRNEFLRGGFRGVIG